MKTAFALLALAASAVSTLAAPNTDAGMVKRADAAKPNDVEILNYALTLEYLERNFYADVLKKFSADAFKKAGYPSSTRVRLQQIAKQEAEHVQFLAGALGEAAVGECSYAFGLTSPKAAIATARLLENVGVSAYLGAAGDITTPAYLAAAASILTVEARHASGLNEATGNSGYPATFDSGLNYAQVYSLAAPLIVPSSCKGAGALPPSIQAFPPLTLVTKGPRAGHKSALKFDAKGNTELYGAFINGGQTLFRKIGTQQTVDVPAGLSGLTFLVITTAKDAAGFTDASTIAGPAPVYLA